MLFKGQDDELFMTLIKTLALSTTTFFQYDPKDEEVKAYYVQDKKAKKERFIALPKDMNLADDAAK